METESAFLLWVMTDSKELGLDARAMAVISARLSLLDRCVVPPENTQKAAVAVQQLIADTAIALSGICITSGLKCDVGALIRALDQLGRVKDTACTALYLPHTGPHKYTTQESYAAWWDRISVNNEMLRKQREAKKAAAVQERDASLEPTNPEAVELDENGHLKR